MKFIIISTLAQALTVASAAVPTSINITEAASSGAVQALGIGAFHPFKSGANSALCVQPQSTIPDANLILTSCNGNNLMQLWAPLQDGTNIYRLQNGATEQCMWLNLDPFNGEIVRTGGCTNSDGSGRPVSNAQWDSGTSLPGQVQLKSHIHFSTNNDWCVDISGSNLAMFRCIGSNLNQRWTIGFD